MSVDLQQFCSDKDDPRYYLHQPVSQGQYTYATNGWLLARVARDDRYPENGAAPDFKTVFPSPLPTNLQPVPEVEESYYRAQPCDKCKGREPDTCANCDGEGMEECFNCGQDTACEDCKGSGLKNACRQCGGEGYVSPEPVFIEISGSRWNQALIYQISQLPGSRIAFPDNSEGRLKPAYFVFDGGDGMVMPARA